jgi:hypothetical protein
MSYLNVPESQSGISPMPERQFPHRAAQDGLQIRSASNDAENVSAPSKYFTGKALAEFMRVWNQVTRKESGHG